MGIENNQLIGQTLGSSTLQSLLGRGGMGAVYLAQQSRPKRTVAIKVLMPELFLSTAGSGEFLTRFRREADAIAALDHVNIMPIYEYGEQGNLAYLVMPLVAGGTLRDILVKRGRLPLTEVVSIIEQISSALDYAHKHGIIHRDLKPGNILFHSDGRLLLTDFGIAKVINEQSLDEQNIAQAMQTLTSTGMIIGTPEYLSPEQATGGLIDKRSDVYSLGIVLYQLLTGQVPFTGTTPVAIAIKHAMEVPPSLTLLDPSIPSDIENVILKAIAKKPDQRYASAGEFARALRIAVNGVSTPLAVSSPNSNDSTLTSTVPSNSGVSIVTSEATVRSNQNMNAGTIPNTPALPIGMSDAPTYLTADKAIDNNAQTISEKIPQTPALMKRESGKNDLSVKQEPKPAGSKFPGRIAILSIVVILLLVVSGAAVYLRFGTTSGNQANSTTQKTPTSGVTATTAVTPTTAANSTPTSQSITPTTAVTPGVTATITTSPPQSLPNPSISVGKLLYGTVLPTCDTGGNTWNTNQYAHVVCNSSYTKITNTDTGHTGEVLLQNLSGNTALPSDYTVEVQMKANNTSGSFGIFFRTQAGGQGGYGFLISSYGYWNGYTIDSASGQKSINFGYQGFGWNSTDYNTIDIVVQGNTFSLYFNGSKQGGITSGNYSSGGLALAVDGGADVLVKNLGIYNIY